MYLKKNIWLLSFICHLGKLCLGAGLLELSCRDIFGKSQGTHSYLALITEKCGKILRKYLCTETLIAQLPQRQHGLPRWQMKDNGYIYFCYKIHLPGDTFLLNVTWGRSSNQGYVTLFQCWNSKRALNKWLIL